MSKIKLASEHQAMRPIMAWANKWVEQFNYEGEVLKAFRACVRRDARERLEYDPPSPFGLVLSRRGALSIYDFTKPNTLTSLVYRVDSGHDDLIAPMLNTVWIYGWYDGKTVETITPEEAVKRGKELYDGRA